MRGAIATVTLVVGIAGACKAPADVPAAVDAGIEARGSAVTSDGGHACRSNDECAAGEYCAFAPRLCGKGKKAGSCAPKPPACTGPRSPVCGCDGKAYDSECAAHAAGVDLAVMGGCKERMPDWAPCGPRYCDARTSYCEIFLSDVFDLPTDYFCRPLPAACLPADGAARTCDCFPDGTRCKAFCGPLPSAPGGVTTFHLTCQGQHPPDE